MTGKKGHIRLDSRLRGNDGKKGGIPALSPVIPAKAGIQAYWPAVRASFVIPAKAGIQCWILGWILGAAQRNLFSNLGCSHIPPYSMRGVESGASAGAPCWALFQASNSFLGRPDWRMMD